MRAPASVTNQDATVDAALKEEQKKVQSVVFDGVGYTDEQANKIVADFNARWIAAGGGAGSKIVARDRIPAWQIKR